MLLFPEASHHTMESHCTSVDGHGYIRNHPTNHHYTILSINQLFYSFLLHSIPFFFILFYFIYSIAISSHYIILYYVTLYIIKYTLCKFHFNGCLRIQLDFHSGRVQSRMCHFHQRIPLFRRRALT